MELREKSHNNVWPNLQIFSSFATTSPFSELMASAERSLKLRSKRYNANISTVRAGVLAL
ncbi:hypothetical protein RRF57_007315 [Xylaria bambusicola]|uniref:Uncharacterized protein n=1 Tax=Xylaria bambusicola TaxID=326684 RepID=A0AAN7UTG9_9PEZI